MSLDKVQIGGVRSFGPRSQDIQYMQFEKPLTLILGKNGAGKTTIIECLKYVTTGEMPPNSDKGHSFVHDPKVADEREVKGQVKLKFTDVHNMTRVVTRSMKATQKKKKMEFKTLDSCMQLEDSQGKKVTITSKCTDMNQEMVEALGVSKAILANVIFCHQEDSNWPLSHGKIVKERFDDIFSATRFIKALANVKDQWKKMESRNKVSEAYLKGLRENKKRVIDMRKDLENAESRSMASKDALGKLEERIAPVQEKLGRIRKNERDIFQLSTELSQKEAKYKEAQYTCNNLKSNIKEEFSGSASELEELVKNFAKSLERSQKEKMEVENEMRSATKMSGTLEKKLTKIQLDIGKYEMEEKNYSSTGSALREMIKQMIIKYRLNFDMTVEFNVEECKAVLEKLKAKIQEMRDDNNKRKLEYEARELDVQQKIDDLRDKRTQLTQITKMHEEQILKNNKEIEALERKLVHVDSAVKKLKTLEDDLNDKERELVEFSASSNENLLQNEIQNFSSTCSTYEAMIRQLDDEFVKLEQNTSMLTQLNLAKKEKGAKEETLRRLKSKNEDKLQQILGEIIDWQTVRSKIREFVMCTEKELKQMAETREKLLISISRLDSQRKMHVKELEEKEKELKAFEEEVFEVCGSRELEDGIKILESQMKELQDENGSLTGTQFVYTKFVEKLRQNDPSCPLCHQSFREQSDVTELIEEVEEKVRLIPSQLVTGEKRIKDQQHRYNKMVELRTIKKRMDVWETEIPELKTKVRVLANDYAKNQSHLTEIDESVKIRQNNLDLANSMQLDTSQVDQLLSDIRKLDKQIESAKVPEDIDESRTAKTVHEEKSSIQLKLDEARTELNAKNRELATFRENVQHLQSSVNKIKEEHLQILKNAQQQSQWKNKKDELIGEVETLLKEKKENQAKLPTIQEKLDVLISEKTEVVRDKENGLAESDTQIFTATSEVKEVTQFIQNVQRYINDGRGTILESSRRELEMLREQDKTAKENFNKSSSRREELVSELANHQARKREMLDNLELKKRDAEMAILEAEIEKVKSRLGDLDIKTLEMEKKELMDDEEKIHSEKNLLIGRTSELRESIRKYKLELNKEPLKNAIQEFQKVFIEVEATKVVVKDLKKLYIALDRAVMQYHSQKMEDVNKIVKELWQSTYKGKDIDYIEICSDTTETDESTIDKRKVYDYKVAKVKDGRKQDMRGQCSAGQRVLACLIIRLALAETLSYNCGIFALDEPTTNLDRENINSLASSLQEIVNNRAQSNTFQLIVITHDKDFLERLGHSSIIDYYYKVLKSDEGHSRITRCNVR